MKHLSSLYIFFIYGLFSLIIGSILHNRKQFYILIKDLPKNIFFWSLVIFCLAFIIRENIIPHMHHVYYDEFYYINLAKNMYHHNIFAVTLAGDISNPEILGRSIRPGGYPFILNLAYRLLGDSENTLFHTNAFLGSVSVVLIFWIGYLLFNNIGISLWSAIIFNFLPAHLKYSGSASSSISSLFFILLGLCFILLYFRIKKLSLLYLLSFIIIFSSYIRPENTILCFLMLILILRENKRNYLNKRDTNQIILSIILLVLPLILQIPSMINIEQANSRGSFISLWNFLNNFVPNLQYLFDSRYHSLISTIFFLIGSVALFFCKRKVWIFLLGWFLIFYFIYTAYFMGRFSLRFSTDSDRHFLLSAIAFSFFSGFGIYFILSRSFLSKSYLRKIFLIISICGALIINSLFATRNITGFTFKRDVYKEYTFLKETSDKLSKDLYILSYDQFYIVSTIDKKVMALELFPKIDNPPKELILFEGFWWCEWKDESKYYEDILRKLYNFDLIAEKQTSNNRKFSFYLLTSK